MARWGCPGAQFHARVFLMMWLRLVPHPPLSSLSLPCDPALRLRLRIFSDKYNVFEVKTIA